MTELDRYKIAYAVLRASMFGAADSEDAADIAEDVIKGKEIDWSKYPLASQEAFMPKFEIKEQ